ncbi:MAG TPA: FAD:protein FMN transferase [Actinophytocola sp.]|uniref:FAD:protein FMN transferase n=1 Tax=Actinophytocola sp. TaxID=1872138 RepID=UPI002F95F587
MTATTSFGALGTTAQVVVTEPEQLGRAAGVLRTRLAELDAACSRFRADSEISRLDEGSYMPVSSLLFDALEVALRAAERTDGLVDPTVGHAVRDLGYDRDFAQVEADGPAPAPGTPAPGWWRILLDPATRRVLLPRGVGLDLGATAKAFAADRAATALARTLGCGVLVSLGGDIAVSGQPPAGGWRITVGEDHATADPARDPTIAIDAGGLATSSTTRRRWRRGEREVHHIVDPRTGDVPAAVWRTVSVAAHSCVTANTASTAAIVLGERAPDWLAARRLPARLVRVDGTVRHAAGWPSDVESAA